MANDRHLITFAAAMRFKKLHESTTLERIGILQSTVLLKTGYQKGEGYSTNIPCVFQAQQIHYFNILNVYWKTFALYLAIVCLSNHWIVLITISNHFLQYH